MLLLNYKSPNQMIVFQSEISVKAMSLGPMKSKKSVNIF